jgi:hypothetical protein
MPDALSALFLALTFKCHSLDLAGEVEYRVTIKDGQVTEESEKVIEWD